MSDESDHGEPYAVHTMKPGDRLLHLRTRRSRLAIIERGMSTPLHEGYHMLAEIITQTPV